MCILYQIQTQVEKTEKDDDDDDDDDEYAWSNEGVN